MLALLCLPLVSGGRVDASGEDAACCASAARFRITAATAADWRNSAAAPCEVEEEEENAAALHPTTT